MERIRDLLYFKTWGNISLITQEGKPEGIPMSYVSTDDMVYFHAPSHAKIASLLKNEICFTCVDELSYIPGNWMTLSGNPGIGTVFYRSVMLLDVPHLITDIKEKTEILNQLSKKFQPDGNYKKMYVDNRGLSVVSVWGLDLNKANYRYRLGENFGQRVKVRILENLQKRGSKLDLRTAKLIKSHLINN